MVGGESVRRFDKCKDGGFDWSGKFCPSRDYLRQFGTSRDWISGVYSGVSVRFPFIGVQNREVRIPLSPPLFVRRAAANEVWRAEAQRRRPAPLREYKVECVRVCPIPEALLVCDCPEQAAEY